MSSADRHSDPPPVDTVSTAFEAQPPPPRRRRRGSRGGWRSSSRAIAIVAFLALWETAPRLGLVDPVFLPPFSEVAAAFVDSERQRQLWEHVPASLSRSLTGFALAVVVAIPLGVAIGWYRPVADFLNPLLELFRNTAALALLPVFVLMLGIGETSKIALVIYACTWPILLNTISGVRTVDPLLIKSARSLGLPPIRLFQKVILPAAVPTIFTGIRLAGASSILVLIAAEMVGAKAGLGYLITSSQYNFQIPNMYAGIIAISVVGLVFNQSSSSIERRFSALARQRPDLSRYRHVTAASPQRVPHGRRPPRGGVAASAHRRRNVGRRPALPGARPDRRARQAGFGLLRRRAGGRATDQAQHPGHLRAAHTADRDGGRDRAHRPDRDGVHHLQRAVQSGPQVRLARPHQRRAGRLEHRDLCRRRRGAPTSASTTSPTRRPVRPRGRVRRCGDRLWDSWEDDALVLDAETGVFADPAKVHAIDHAGDRFRVRGPLNSPRSPQGRPLLVQAGSSESGKDFAARYAEAVFTAQRTLAEGQAFYRDLKARAVKFGRSADEVKILPGIVPFIGPTEAEAKALEQQFTDLISPEYSLRQLSEMLGVDLTTHSLDAPLPPLPPIEQIQGNKSRYQLVKDLAARESLTVRQLIAKLGGGRGHRTFAGTPEQIADELAEWFAAGAADGFNVMPPYLPGGLEDFVDHVVPILQQRGLFRTGYNTSTLRGHYGLAHRPSRFTPTAAESSA